MEAEKRGEGKLNWDYFNSAVKRVRDIIDKIKQHSSTYIIYKMGMVVSIVYTFQLL